MSPTPFAPRINHVAISVDADVMDEEGRAALFDFFSEIFGWTEGDNSTEKGNPLILYTGSLGQFLYLLPAKDEFMVTPNMDHFGMEVSSKEELMEILERVKAYQRKDDRVRLTEVGAMVTRYNDKRVHAHQRLHLVLDPAVDRAAARRAAHRGLTPCAGKIPHGIHSWWSQRSGRCGSRTHDLNRVNPFEPLSVTWNYQGQPGSVGRQMGCPKLRVDARSSPLLRDGSRTFADTSVWEIESLLASRRRTSTVSP